jgi:large subunit ribosomal protein L29
MIMAVIKKNQMKEMTNEDMGKRLMELRLELAKDRAQIAVGGAPVNPGRVKEVRRTIARLLTQIKKKSTGKEVVRAG